MDKDNSLNPKRLKMRTQYKTKGLIIRESPEEMNLCRCAGSHPNKPNWCKNEEHECGTLCNNVLVEGEERRCTKCEKGTNFKKPPRKDYQEPSVQAQPWYAPGELTANDIVDMACYEGYSHLLSHGKRGRERPSGSRKIQTEKRVCRGVDQIEEEATPANSVGEENGSDDDLVTQIFEVKETLRALEE